MSKNQKFKITIWHMMKAHRRRAKKWFHIKRYQLSVWWLNLKTKKTKVVVDEDLLREEEFKEYCKYHVLNGSVDFPGPSGNFKSLPRSSPY